MSRRVLERRRSAWAVRSASAVVAIVTLVVGLFPAGAAAARPPLAPQSPLAQVAAADIRPATLAGFTPGNIISDAVFFNSGSMNESQIQSFLNGKVPSCQSGYVCLKDFRQSTYTRPASLMCPGTYTGEANEPASRIVAKVAQACGINPQVLLTTLQKEQGLVTHTWPSDWRYTIAMGQGCPDTAACDTKYYGFFNQVYGAASQFKRYANPPGTSQYFTWYAPGKTWNVRYHPNVSCGSSPVFIQNQATANLYYYTPYQPNGAALAAGFREANDPCSSYGNRNFYNYFTDWFGSTQTSSSPCQLPPENQITAASGEYIVNVASLNARQAPSTACGDGVVSLAQGTTVVKLGEYGSWWRVSVNGGVYWVASQYLVVVVPRSVDAFVRAVYVDLLGRDGAAEERVGWGQAIALGAPPTQVAQGFVNSDEFRILKITEAYREVLGREPDEGGMTAWLNGMRAGILSPDDAYRGLLRSDEYYTRTGGTDPAFVAALYEKILHRTAGQEEIDGWSRVAAVAGRAAVVDSIWMSMEAAGARVAMMYRSYLGREADQAAMEGWGDQGLRYGDNAVRMGILGSPEYQSRAITRFP
ncbi:DUF4214 domain-containing protein [Microbacterium sp. DT81.1]|uniref:DUF4214 domain-containing protein n=1 Tax=Microbacterium sp. DT81.1 TaxID=3393413 RepID=UPI003CF851A1